ncbi:MAG: phenylalanine--tRNA ligase subunit alpha [Elusimicrobiota bacterium]
MDLDKQWEAVSADALGAVSRAGDLAALEETRVRLLGRKGSLTELLKSLKDLPLEDKRVYGAKANGLKNEVAKAIEARRAELERAAASRRIAETQLDLTLPGAPMPQGRPHPLTQTIREMTSILSSMGFCWAEGPLIESEYYNFEALNIPADHPARDMQDTLYVDGTDASPKAQRLMRTHTSPVQIRFLEAHKPPVRIMAPGRVFRRDAVDASHSAVFHQIEGLYVDRGVTLADLKGTLDEFLKRIFGPSARSRLRPSYFPFTEPSAEVDVRCLICSGKGCAVCKQSGWLEMLGSGMVHPNVLRGVGLDPEEWSGYAWGMGVERFAMFRYGIPDIRMFYENDVRFLEQFG